MNVSEQKLEEVIAGIVNNYAKEHNIPFVAE